MSIDTRPQPMLDQQVGTAPSTTAGSADRRQRLIAPIVVHFLQDFTAIVLVTLLPH